MAASRNGKHNGPLTTASHVASTANATDPSRRANASNVGGSSTASAVGSSASRHHPSGNGGSDLAVREQGITLNGSNVGRRFGKGKDIARDIQPMDFNTLDISVLRRYKRIHKLKVQEPATKEQLVAAVSRHYAAVKPVENEVIATFIYAVRNKDNVLKLPIP